MVPVSVVIITKNEAEFIADCINMSKLITDDIVIVDNGSTDETLSLAEMSGCKIHQTCWDGYGANKNKGIGMAKYNWILSIDADEVPDTELIEAIHSLNIEDENLVYDIKFKSYFGAKRIRFGSWGRDHHIRLFNRNVVKWTEPEVHETLLLPKTIKKRKLDGAFHHYSVKNTFECKNKAVFYAKLSAEKYFKSGKRSNFVNMYLSPVFVFIKTYILLLGFLDGKEGWDISRTTFKNRWLKYHYLNYLENSSKKKQVMKGKFAVNY